MPGTEPGTKMVQVSYRAICFTEFKKLTEWEDVKSQLRYYAYAEETCPNTGKKHYQGFAYSWKKIRFSAWKKMFPTAHLEQMRGNFRENTCYCSKEGTLTEFGEKPNENGVQGSAIEYKRRLDEGQMTMEIAEDPDLFGQYLRSYKALEKYENHIRGKRVKKDHKQPEIYIRWGESGSGKTRWVYEQYGVDRVVVMLSKTGRWFNGIQYGDVMLFDDVGPDSIPKIEWFLNLTDRYPIPVETKGGETWWKPKVIVFTSNLPWDQWWNSISVQHKVAIKRRISRVTRVYKDREVVEYENADHFILSQTQGGYSGPTRSDQEISEQSLHEAQDDDQTSSFSDEQSSQHEEIQHPSEERAAVNE